MQEHNTERQTIGEIQERNTTEKQQSEIAENENRAHNNQTDTGRIRKAIPISPFFALRASKRHTYREIHTKGDKTSRR